MQALVQDKVISLVDVNLLHFFDLKQDNNVSFNAIVNNGVVDKIEND